MIPLTNPLASYKEHQFEIDRAIHKVLESGSYILGEEVKKFEKSFAKFIGVRHAIGVASGTDALFLSLKAIDIGDGDEVITVSHTAVATVAAICMTGAEPVLVDIDSHTFNIDPAEIDKAITERTRAIIPVHLYGKPCDMKRIMKIATADKLAVIEDCAQATGAKTLCKRVGSIGTLGAFSFYPTKNLGCFGDGGAITTNSDKLAKKLLMLRQYGWEKRISKIEGYNSRLDEIQAAILNVKLKYLDHDNNVRRELVKKHSGSCDKESVYHLNVIRSKNRKKLIKEYALAGMATGIHYPVPIHLQPAYIGIRTGSMAHTEKAAREVVSVPL